MSGAFHLIVAHTGLELYVYPYLFDKLVFIYTLCLLATNIEEMICVSQ